MENFDIKLYAVAHAHGTLHANTINSSVKGIFTYRLGKRIS